MILAPGLDVANSDQEPGWHLDYLWVLGLDLVLLSTQDSPT